MARRGTLILAVAIILIGILLLLRALGVVTVDVGGLIGALILVAIGASILWYVVTRPEERALEGQEAAIPLEDAGEASIHISHGAGRLAVSAGAGPGELARGTFRGGLRTTVKRQGGKLDVVMRPDVEVVSRAVFTPWRFGAGRGLDWSLGLSPDVPLSLRLDTGAGDLRLDLSELQVTDLRLSTGASSTALTLPAKAGHTRVDIDAGAASVRVRVPEGVAARIRVGGGLASTMVDRTRFPRSGAVYRSPDYDTANNRADIQVDTGLGSVRVV